MRIEKKICKETWQQENTYFYIDGSKKLKSGKDKFPGENKPEIKTDCVPEQKLFQKQNQFCPDCCFLYIFIFKELLKLSQKSKKVENFS